MYRIVRFYFSAGINRRTIKTVSSEVAAQLHCGNPETSSSTCKGKVGRARTRKLGKWFDGYEECR